MLGDAERLLPDGNFWAAPRSGPPRSALAERGPRVADPRRGQHLSHEFCGARGSRRGAIGEDSRRRRCEAAMVKARVSERFAKTYVFLVYSPTVYCLYHPCLRLQQAPQGRE